MSTKEFPTNFTFPNVPVGHRMTQMFPLRCDAPIDFEFQLAYIQPHPAFTVNPMNGKFDIEHNFASSCPLTVA
jgi:hypothetical protein